MDWPYWVAVFLECGNLLPLWIFAADASTSRTIVQIQARIELRQNRKKLTAERSAAI